MESMRSLRGLTFSLIPVFVLLSGCGNNGGIKAPSALSYATSSAVYTKGVAIAPDVPTSSGGTVAAYSVSPALPAGLALSITTGIVSGTPTAVVGVASYVVTASSSAGSTIATLSITVNDQPPSTLSYSINPAVYAVQAPIAANNPTNSGGAVTAYTVSPALPSGLSLNATTGAINGTPTIVTAQANYVVTATDSGGNTTATLSIATEKVVPSQPAIACVNIQQLDIPNTQITEAVLVPANSTPYSTYGDLPEHCLVQGIVGARTGVPAPVMNMYGVLDNTLAPDANYGISFELRMPTTTWNGDFFFTGGSGNDGIVGEAVGDPLGGGTAYLPALYQGFAVITQNSGHVAIEDALGYTQDVLGDQNTGFGYDPQARYDYGYQQTGTITPLAKSILAAFYGVQPLYSYYLGCSNGGREAMVASQRWGDMFDGIVVGDPGFRLAHSAIAESWNIQQFASAAQAVEGGADPLDPNGNPSLIPAASSADLALVAAMVTQSCDALDGVVDGMIFDTADCKNHFDPATLSQLQCAGAKTPTCLLPQQIAAIQNVFKGPVDSTGNSLYSDWPYDAGIADPRWMMWTIGATLNIVGIPTPIPFVSEDATLGATATMYLFTTPPNPSLNVFTVSMDDLSTGINATNSTFAQSAVDYLEASSTDLDTFTSHNGKILYYHGESDPIFSMNDTVNYYQNLTSRYGTNTQNFARLFLVPGMNHCSSGLHTLDSFDPLTAIVNWVEDGTAPDTMIAANSNPATVPPGPVYTYLPVNRTRPLCPYPQFAHYTGTGSSEDAANFTCAGPLVGGCQHNCIILAQPQAIAPQH
jgi:feruloyl esterase